MDHGRSLVGIQPLSWWQIDVEVLGISVSSFFFLTGIVDYMSDQAGPPSKQVQTLKQVQEILRDGDDAVIVGVFSSEEDAAYEIYQEACVYYAVWKSSLNESDLIFTFNFFSNNLFSLHAGNSLRDDYKFMHTFNNEVAKFLKASPGQVVMLHSEKFRSKYEPASHSLTIKVSSASLMFLWDLCKASLILLLRCGNITEI